MIEAVQANRRKVSTGRSTPPVISTRELPWSPRNIVARSITTMNSGPTDPIDGDDPADDVDALAGEPGPDDPDPDDAEPEVA